MIKKYHFKKFLIVFLIYFIFIENTYGEPGDDACVFIKIPVFSRATALGNAYCAITDDAAAIYYNPASSVINGTSLNFSYNKHLLNINHGAGSLITGNGIAGVGLGINFLHTGPIKKYDELQNYQGEFSASNMNILLSFGIEIIRNICVGVGIKYFRERLDDKIGAAYAGDVGILLKHNIFSVGAAAQQIVSTKIKFIEKEAPLVKLFRAGLVVGPIKSFTVVADIEKIAGYKKSNIYCGAEIKVAKILAIRAGYLSSLKKEHLGKSKIIPTGIVIGSGLNFGFLNFDFAYLPYGLLDQTYKASLSIRY